MLGRQILRHDPDCQALLTLILDREKGILDLVRPYIPCLPSEREIGDQSCRALLHMGRSIARKTRRGIGCAWVFDGRCDGGRKVD